MTVKVEIFDRDLTRTALVGELLELDAKPRWRDVGGWRLTVPDGPAAKALQEPGSSITVEVDGTLVMSGPTREASWGPDGTVDAYGFDDLVWIAGRLALTAATSPYPESLDYTGVAETVIYSLVGDNAGPSAAIARQVVALATGEARGTSGTWKAANQPLLDLVREIAVGQGWGMRVRQSGGVRTFSVLVPNDVSASVRLHEDKGAIADWKRTLARPEATWVLAAGTETTGSRPGVDAESVDADDWGRIETWVDERETAVTAELEAARDAALAEHGEVDAVAAEVAPLGAFTFGADYGMADVVSVEAGGIRRLDTVVGLDITPTTVTPVLSGGLVLPALPSLRRISELERRMHRLETR